MRALSFQQPWLYAMQVLGKDVENRKWACFEWMIGQPCLIHSSAGFDHEGYEWLISEGYDIPDRKEFGPNKPMPLSKSAIVGKLIFTSTEPFDYEASLFSEDHGPWAFGPHVWRFKDVQWIDGCYDIKGALGFWQVDPITVSDLHTIGGLR